MSEWLLPEPREDEEVVMFLERDQLSAGRRVRLPRARLGRGGHVLLWVLRLFTLVVGAMVVYTFVAQLG
ncbi:MAG TPA: hypothetical protein VFN48_07440 [Solirubrobacteraceae bacterium]|nr:hypothetical protein [Solirubrobacteraceae bacterium]